MQLVQREEILDYVTYEERRSEIRSRVMEVKAARRVHVGDYLTFLFENADTVRYQVQEMVRAERMVREADIRHELDTYNELLGGKGELALTLLIEIDDLELRDNKLRELTELPSHLYVRLTDGRRVRPRFDTRQVGRDRLSAVQYLHFDTGGLVPVAVGADHPLLSAETELTSEQRRAIAADLVRTADGAD
jgi:hypothetical protein